MWQIESHTKACGDGVHAGLHGQPLDYLCIYLFIYLFNTPDGSKQ